MCKKLATADPLNCRTVASRRNYENIRDNKNFDKIRQHLDVVFAQVTGDERPYLRVQIFDRELIGLLDSGASRTILGGPGWRIVEKMQLRMKSSTFDKVTVANGEKAHVLGTVSLPVRLEEKIFVIDMLVVPTLNHTLILGIDFWQMAKIIPNFRTGQWQFAESEPIVASMEAIVPHAQLTSEQSERINKIIAREVKQNDGRIGCTTLVEHRISVKEGTQPIKQRYYPLSPHLQKHADAEIDKLLEQGVISRSQSAWSSPIVMVPKKTGEYRMAIDYRRLNAVSEKDAYPTPYCSAILDRLRGAKFLSSLDVRSAFYQIPMEKESRKFTAFTVPNRGLFEFNRLPFGLHNSGSSWQRLIDRVLSDLEPYVFMYLDDIIIITQDFDEHIRVLEEVFLRMRRAGLTLNTDKCQICRESLKFLGYVVDESGLHVDPDKVKSIVDIPTPTKVTHVRSILGMASWYRRFIPNFAEVVAPLNKLLKKNEKFFWSRECEEGLREIKNRLVAAPILACPNFEKPFVIQCDASAYGIGAVLIQQYDDREHVIAYLSRSLTHQERKYSTTERECLAVIWSIEKLRPYIEGGRFTVVTDHYSLLWLNNLKDNTGRLGRWCLRLQQYDFEIIHRKGKEHLVPDALSRCMREEEIPEISLCEISKEEIKDKWYLRMRKRVCENNNHFPLWRVTGDKLYKFVLLKYPALSERDTEWREVVPKELRLQVMRNSHDDPKAGHGGVNKTLFRVQAKYYWPDMVADIANFVRKCSICAKSKPEQKAPAGFASARKVVTRPWEAIAIDIVGPLPKSSRGNRFILCVLDTFSKFLVTFAMRNATASKVCELLEERIFLMFGAPKTIICDNGVQFISKQFRKLSDEYGTTLAFNANYHPQANPVERYNRTLKTMLRCYVFENHQHWDKLLPKVTCAIRSSVNDVTRETPYFINFGREMCTENEKVSEQVANDVEIAERMSEKESKNQRAKLYDEVKRRLSEAAEKVSKRYNLRRRHITYHVNQPVWRKNFAHSDMANHITAKFTHKFIGPFYVSKKVSPWTYELRDNSGKPRGVWNVKDLKPSNADEDYGKEL